MRKPRGNAMFVVNHLGCNFFLNAKEKDRPKPVFLPLLTFLLTRRFRL